MTEREVQLTVLREGEEMAMTVPTTQLYSFETNHIVFWAGATLQTPILAVRETMRSIPSNVYISSITYGSPANQYGVASEMFVTEVDGKSISSLDDFLAIIKAKSKAHYRTTAKTKTTTTIFTRHDRYPH